MFGKLNPRSHAFLADSLLYAGDFGRSPGWGNLPVQMHYFVFAALIPALSMPSNTARSCGTIFPLIRHIHGLYGSEPGETARKIGAYIIWTALAATCITSSTFLTALASNLLAPELIKKTVHLDCNQSDDRFRRPDLG